MSKAKFRFVIKPRDEASDWMAFYQEWKDNAYHTIEETFGVTPNVALYKLTLHAALDRERNEEQWRL